MELEKAADGLCYLSGAVNIGFIEGEKGLIVVDTGLDDGTARKILSAAKELSRSISTIIITHAHADHIGGCAALVKNTGATLYAPFFEKDVVEYPFWEPVYLSGGASPIKELRDKFLEAEPSKVDCMLAPGDVTIDGVKLEVLSLPGHTFNQVGLVYNNILFAADSIFPAEVLEKHQIPFGVDVESWISTLNMLSKTGFAECILGHGALKESYQEAAQRHLEWLEELNDEIFGLICEKSDNLSGLLARVCSRRGIQLGKVRVYYLLQTSLMAHLTYLQKREKIALEIQSGELLWSAC